MKICNYAELDALGEYPYYKDYSYLALWDMLDCRVAFYLGFLLPNDVGKAIMDSPVGGGLTAGIFELVLTAILTFNGLLLLFLVLFGVMFLSVVVYLVHLYVIAMIAIAILIFVGPIFVPMFLFERTKSYFNAWIKQIMGYTLQPAIVAAFIVLMIAVFDSAMYGSYGTDSTNSRCKFKTPPDTITVRGNKTVPYWIMEDPDKQSTNCTDSLGYFMMTKLSGVGLSKQNLVSGKNLQLLPFVKIGIEVAKVIGSLTLCAFFAFLFYYFGEQVSGFASDLSGASNIGRQTVGANAVTDTVKAVAEIALNVATDGAYGKAKQVASAVKDGADNASAKIEEAPDKARDIVVSRGKAPQDGGGAKPDDPGIAVGGGGGASGGVPGA
jgi:type IV secretion system protein VirB6